MFYTFLFKLSIKSNFPIQTMRCIIHFNYMFAWLIHNEINDELVVNRFLVYLHVGISIV